MEVKGETSEMVALFWKTFAHVVSNVKGHSYLFNPRGFLVDEAGCNFNGIKEVFGENGLSKACSCQFHFGLCLDNLLKKISGELAEIKVEVRDLGKAILNCNTLTYYNEIRSRLLVIGGVVPTVSNFVEWWHARRYHLFPIFRGYSIASLNLATVQ